MYNYLIKIIPTTLKFIPVYILLKINVTPLNLAFAKRSQIVVKFQATDYRGILELLSIEKCLFVKVGAFFYVYGRVCTF